MNTVKIVCFPGSSFTHKHPKPGAVEVSTVRGDKWLLSRTQAAQVMRELRKIGRGRD